MQKHEPGGAVNFISTIFTLPVMPMLRSGDEWQQTSLSWSRPWLQLLCLSPVSPRENALPLCTSVSSSRKYKMTITLCSKVAGLNIRWASNVHMTMSDAHPLSVLANVSYLWPLVSRIGRWIAEFIRLYYTSPFSFPVSKILCGLGQLCVPGQRLAASGICGFSSPWELMLHPVEDLRQPSSP